MTPRVPPPNPRSQPPAGYDNGERGGAEARDPGVIPPTWSPNERPDRPPMPVQDVEATSSFAGLGWRPDEGPSRPVADGTPVVTADDGDSDSWWRPDEGGIERGNLRDGDRDQVSRGPARDRPAKDVPFKRARSRRAGRVAAIILLIVLVAFLGDLAYATAQLSSALDDVKTKLEDGRTSLRNGAVAASQKSFASAARSARRAEGLVDHPAWTLLTYLPLIGRDGRAVEALSEAGELSARAGGAAAQAGEALDVDGSGFANSIYQDGTVRFDKLDKGVPYVARAADLLSRGADVLSEAPPPSLGLVDQKLTAAKSALSSADESAAHARSLLSALPSLLGRTSSRSYLLGFQALGEARATGGVMGVYGVLDAADGKLRLRRIVPYLETFPNKFPAVEGPRWFEKSYGTQMGLRQWPQANLSPNFPAVSEVLLNMYEAQTGKRLDGVFALDPVALARLMQGLDPLEVPELDEPIRSDNVERILMHDSYVDFPDEQEQNLFLKHVVEEFWQRVSDGDLDGPDFIAGLADAARTQHVKIFSRLEEDQEALADLRVDGSYDHVGPNLQLMYGNSNLGSKVDYFLTRSIDTTIQLDSSGAARVQTVVTLENSAPTGPPSLLLGPVTQDTPPGLNRSLLNFLLPLGSKVSGLEIDDRAKVAYRYREEDHPVIWNVVDIPAGGTTEVRLGYSFDRAATISDDGGHFNFTLFPQTTLNPDAYSITVAPPRGYSFSSSDGLTPNEEGLLVQTGSLEEPVTLSVDLQRE